MPSIWEMLITILCSVIASSGFWTYLQKRIESKDDKTNLVLGLGYDRIFSLGSEYIERGSITQDEYENLYKYIYLPYHEIRPDDPTVDKIMEELNKLPIKSSRRL